MKPGDGVLFDLGKPESRSPAAGCGGHVAATRRGRGSVELQFEAGAIDLVADPRRLRRLQDRRPRPAEAARTELRPGQAGPARAARRRALTGEARRPLTLTLTDDDGHTATATWPGPLELARKQPTTPDEVREQLARLGDTPFELGEVVGRVARRA